MTLAEIQKEIREFFNSEKGIYINKHLDLIDLIENIFVTKRSLKHIVEQRKKDNYDSQKIDALFSELYELFLSGNFILVPNKNNTDILIEINEDKKTLIVAVIENNPNGKVLKTAFYRSTRKLKKYFPKNKKS